MFDVTFVCPDGQTITEFTHQSRKQVMQLVGHPPYAAVLCAAEMRVRGEDAGATTGPRGARDERRGVASAGARRGSRR